jgi:hypothetical protein
MVRTPLRRNCPFPTLIGCNTLSSPMGAMWSLASLHAADPTMHVTPSVLLEHQCLPTNSST